MDKNFLVSRLNSVLPGVVLEVRRFGKSSLSSIWVEAQSIPKVAEALKNDEELLLDWLENLSVVELEKVLVVTYFLRSTQTAHDRVLRLSVIPSDDQAVVSVPSIQEIWPMGKPMENEAQEMFGIQFQNAPGGEEERRTLLPQNWKGFPLRKSFQLSKHESPHSLQKKTTE